MKRISFYTCIALVTIGITSCVKKSEETIANAWRVANYYEETTHPDGSTSTFSNGDSPYSPNELIIDKDGTWTWNRHYSSTITIFGGSILLSIKTSETQKGTWAFVKVIAGDNLAKNDRLLFNTLSKSTVNSQTGGGGNPNFPDTTTSSSETYATGENKLVYTITKFDEKTMWMESESSDTNSSGGVSTKKTRFVLGIN
nr:hypothetical protein [uncultured Fluviicola sp.]